MFNLIHFSDMKNLQFLIANLFLILTHMNCTPASSDNKEEKTFTLYQIGEVVKENDKTFIVVNEKYLDGMMDMEKFSELTVLYWFDQNDIAENRSILQVHPRDNKDNPMRGVFTTHAPVRPNLIAITKCKILSIKDNIIEVDEIDAFNHSPVIDIKS